MGAMKALAIDLEARQDQASDGTSFRLGLLAACNLILDVKSAYTTRVDPEGSAAWDALNDAFNLAFDAAEYLASCRYSVAHANGPAVD